MGDENEVEKQEGAEVSESESNEENATQGQEFAEAEGSSETDNS